MREHITDGKPCWCGPTAKRVDDAIIWVHPKKMAKKHRKLYLRRAMSKPRCCDGQDPLHLSCFYGNDPVGKLKEASK